MKNIVVGEIEKNKMGVEEIERISEMAVREVERRSQNNYFKILNS